MIRRAPLLFALVAALLFAGSLWWYAVHWRPEPAAYPVQGVSVSAASGAIEWPAVKAAGSDFAYIRASAGERRDPQFEANWQGAHDAGLRRGALHVFSLCRPAALQARAYMTTVPRETDALPAAVALDFDPACTARPDRASVVAEVNAFLAAAEHHDGRAMLLRISPAFEKEYQLSHLLARPLWAVRTWLIPDYLARPWRIWQASGIRRVQGIAGPVEWSVVAP